MRRTEAPNRVSSPFIASEASREAAREIFATPLTVANGELARRLAERTALSAWKYSSILCFRVIGQHFPLFSNVFYSDKTTVKYQR